MDREELKRLTKEEISRRIREGVKAVIEQVLEEEMTEHLAAGYRERTPSRRGERNGYYTRDLITPAGRIAQLRVPRDREGTFLTEVFERYKRMTGEVEEAVLEMYLQGVSTRKVAAITEGLSRVRIGKDAVSRVAQRLEEELSAWRGRPLELAYPYLYLDAAYFKVNWGGRVVDLALLVAVGVNAEGYREVLYPFLLYTSPMTVANHLTLNELWRRAKKAKDPIEKDRFLAVYHAKRGLTAKEIARIIPNIPRWVQQTVRRYNLEGPEALKDKRHQNPGQKPKLTPEERMRVLEALQGPPPDGGLWTGPKLRDWVERELGKKLSLYPIYRLLHEMGFALRVPRPRHRKADGEAQEAFKKTSSPRSRRRGPRGGG
jgi:transposase